MRSLGTRVLSNTRSPVKGVRKPARFRRFCEAFQRTQSSALLLADISTLVPLFVVCVTGGYGLGTYFGKLFAWLLGRDRGAWGDLGGVFGGIGGLGLYLRIALGIVRT